MADSDDDVSNFLTALSRAKTQPTKADPATRLSEGLGIPRWKAKEYLFPFIYGAQGLSGKALDAHVDDILGRAKEAE